MLTMIQSLTPKSLSREPALSKPVSNSITINTPAKPVFVPPSPVPQPKVDLTGLVSLANEKPPEPEKVVIGIDPKPSSSPIQPPQNISISSMAQATFVPRMSTVNMMSQPNNLEEVRSKLKDTGLVLIKTLYFAYSDGSMTAALLYCQTVHGQYVMVEPPQNMKVLGGDLSLNIQRVGILPTSTIEFFSKELQSIHTGYVYVGSGGIHLMRSPNQEPVYYGYDNLQTASDVFDIKKYHYLIFPLVNFVKLIEPGRLNTLEAHINQHTKGLMREIIAKAGLTTLLTMKGPFTLFMPTDNKLKEILGYDQERLRAVMLAHLVPSRIDAMATLNDGKSPKSELLEVTAVAQNKVTIIRVDGKVVKLSASGRDYVINANEAVHKYNGVLYRFDGLLNPVSQVFKMPESSDFDNVVTIFDINRSTMEIRRAQYSFNNKKQREMFETLTHINSMSQRLMDEISQQAAEEGNRLLTDSNALMQLFYTREVPCTLLCVELDQLADRVREENEEFERLLRISTRFASLKVPLEETLLKLARIDQRFHVKNIVDRVIDPTPLEYDF
jgi:uncharacterized surface protein with fasciclin (FAS1) repeats